jgi:kynurenine formamidase
MTVTMDEIAALALDCRNWGRWGDDDELGTLNYVTGETILTARDEIRSGQMFSLAIDLGPSGPQTNGFRGRFNPIHWMLQTGTDSHAAGHLSGVADDVVEVCVHGATHWDGLGHVFFEGAMWNGYDMRLVTAGGVGRNAITEVRSRLVGRGVLADVATWKGAAALDPGVAISADDLDACLDEQGVELKPGDFLLVRTGQMGVCLLEGWGDFAGGDAPGLALDTALWLKQRSVAAVATDTWGAEVRPNTTPELSQPWHRLVIPNVGLTVGEMFDLEELAKACAADGRYTFCLTAPSLPIVGGTGSPVNPIAIR